MNKKLWWDGSLPFEQRRSVENFEDRIERTLGKFTRAYSANTEPVSIYVPSSLETCGEGGFGLFTATIVSASPFDHNDMISAITHTFAPLGYELLTRDENHTRWMDEANDGYITLVFFKSGGTDLATSSGCRPTDSITKANQTCNIPT